MGKAKGRAWIGFSSWKSVRKAVPWQAPRCFWQPSSQGRRDSQDQNYRLILHQPTSKTKGKEFRPKRISVERKDLAGPVNGRWLANLSAWGKVIEFTAEMLHKRSEIRWLHTNQSTLEFERRKTNLNVRIGSFLLRNFQRKRFAKNLSKHLIYAIWLVRTASMKVFGSDGCPFFSTESDRQERIESSPLRIVFFIQDKLAFLPYPNP